MIKKEALPAQPPWLPANLAHISHRFEQISPQQILRWGATLFGPDLVLGTGFGPSGVVLMHMVQQLGLEIEIFYLQTDLFFNETLTVRDQLKSRLGISFTEVHSGLSLGQQERQFGPRLWQRSPNLCCHLRKVAPLRNYLTDKRAWVTGIRHDQSAGRAHVPILSWDAQNQVIKLAPLANWDKKKVWKYIMGHQLPYNELHDFGYPSIGCWPCTTAVSPQATNERAGRWAGLAKTECGIHVHN